MAYVQGDVECGGDRQRGLLGVRAQCVLSSNEHTTSGFDGDLRKSIRPGAIGLVEGMSLGY